MKGILLLNTGSPNTCKRKDVKSFITEMLSDPQVMTVPNWLRPILVKGLIAPLRQFTSAQHYSLIWDNKHHASPLIWHSCRLAEKIATLSGLPTQVAMRYGKPDIASALKRLFDNDPDLKEVVVMPLYPQYADSSYKTAVDAVCDCVVKNSYSFSIKFVEPYYHHRAYIKALAKSMQPLLEQPFDKLIFNYHSLPLGYVEQSWAKGKAFDYVYQTKETIRLVLNELNINQTQTRLAYSSAMGFNWLKPSLSETVKILAQEGARSIVVVSPGFAADNLETLYDINIVAKQHFLKHGGEKFTYIPCLNSEDYWAEAVLKMI